MTERVGSHGDAFWRGEFPLMVAWAFAGCRRRAALRGPRTVARSSYRYDPPLVAAGNSSLPLAMPSACVRTYVRVRSRHDPARRPRCVLRVGRATRRPAPARAAGDRRRRGRARRELRGQGVRHPLGDGRAAGPPAVPAGDRRRARACRRTPRRAKPCSRCSTTRRRSSRGCRSTRPSSTSAGSRRVSGTPTEIAIRLRREVLERVGLPITVGVARTKFLAKVASAVAKPDGLLFVPPDRELEFLHPLPVERLWGVGPRTASKLHDRGIARWAKSPGSANRCSSACSGRDRDGTCTRSRTTTIRGRCRSAAGAARWDPNTRSAAGRVTARARRDRGRSSSTASTRRMRAADRVGRTVVLRLRFGDFTRVTRSHTLERATAHTETILATVISLLHAARPHDRATRDHAGRHRRRQPRRRHHAARAALRPRAGEALDAALDDVRERFGSAAVTRAARARLAIPVVAMPLLPD